jgi:hypothetical protein
MLLCAAIRDANSSAICVYKNAIDFSSYSQEHKPKKHFFKKTVCKNEQLLHAFLCYANGNNDKQSNTLNTVIADKSYASPTRKQPRTLFQQSRFDFPERKINICEQNLQALKDCSR